MAQLVVRGIEERVKQRLQRRAKRHGRSMEDEIRHILRDAAKDERIDVLKLGSRIAGRFKGRGVTADVTELRGEPVRPASFEE